MKKYFILISLLFSILLVNENVSAYEQKYKASYETKTKIEKVLIPKSFSEKEKEILYKETNLLGKKETEFVITSEVSEEKLNIINEVNTYFKKLPKQLKSLVKEIEYTDKKINEGFKNFNDEDGVFLGYTFNDGKIVINTDHIDNSLFTFEVVLHELAHNIDTLTMIRENGKDKYSASTDNFVKYMVGLSNVSYLNDEEGWCTLFAKYIQRKYKYDNTEPTKEERLTDYYFDDLFKGYLEPLDLEISVEMKKEIERLESKGVVVFYDGLKRDYYNTEEEKIQLEKKIVENNKKELQKLKEFDFNNEKEIRFEWYSSLSYIEKLKEDNEMLSNGIVNNLLVD